MKCEICGDGNNYRLHFREVWACGKCLSVRNVSRETLNIGEMVTLRPAPGQSVKMRRSDIDEIKRLRILPYNKPGGGWYPGRIGDNGKIEERYLKT